jgi:hypothetical protein
VEVDAVWGWEPAPNRSKLPVLARCPPERPAERSAEGLQRSEACLQRHLGHRLIGVG